MKSEVEIKKMLKSFEGRESDSYDEGIMSALRWVLEKDML